jgi:hypothetical protein
MIISKRDSQFEIRQSHPDSNRHLHSQAMDFHDEMNKIAMKKRSDRKGHINKKKKKTIWYSNPLPL